MAVDKVLIDTNICLDAILRRKPFAADALEIIERSEMGEFTGLIAAHSCDTLFFILNQKVERVKAYKAIKSIRKAFKIAAVNQQIIDDALDDEWDDFEDAIHYHAASQAGCQAIITRNEKDFRDSGLSILSPIEFIRQL